jgi:hypothetical protein
MRKIIDFEWRTNQYGDREFKTWLPYLLVRIASLLGFGGLLRLDLHGGSA